MNASPFIWLGSLRRTKGGTENIANYKLASVGSPNPDCGRSLCDVISAAEQAYLNNFPFAILVLGSQVLNVHYEKVLQIAGSVPIALLHGDVQCGKSTIQETALVLMGTSHSHMLKSCTDLQLMKVCSQTTLGVVIDDIHQRSREGNAVLRRQSHCVPGWHNQAEDIIHHLCEPQGIP